jgi:ADP-heptose:LPS heptosyltransferase
MQARPFDLAFAVGDNRYSWLAAAMGAAHVVAHDGDAPATKDWFVDEKRAYPRERTPWGEIVAQLADGPDPPPYARGDWPAPSSQPFDLPAAPYAVLHVGASTPLKLWPAERWRALAEGLAGSGCTVAWSAGRGEEGLVAQVDPEGRFHSYAGRLDLAQVWRLVANAQLLIAPDTGIAHLGRVAWTPTLALFGPGSVELCANGDFWRDVPWRPLGQDPFPCRDQRVVFRRPVDWVRRCGRTTRECSEPRCMHAIGVEEVLAAARGWLPTRQ